MLAVGLGVDHAGGLAAAGAETQPAEEAAPTEVAAVTTPALAGSIFKIELTHDEEPVDTDVLSFTEQTLNSAAWRDLGFPPPAYTTSGAGPVVNFEAVAQSDQEGTTTWKGAVLGDAIQGDMVWAKPGQEPLRYVFAGKREATLREATLYDRLGGLYGIASAIDYFVDRMYDDNTLMANDKVARTLADTPRAGVKFQFTAQFCQRAGGPQAYQGQSIAAACRGLNITQPQWDALVRRLQDTLDKFDIPAGEQAEVRAVVEGLRGDVVESAK